MGPKGAKFLFRETHIISWGGYIDLTTFEALWSTIINHAPYMKRRQVFIEKNLTKIEDESQVIFR